MIDKVLNELVDEIAIEGEQGCTFDQLFTFIESLSVKSLQHITLAKPIRFDDNYKAYIWSHLRTNDQLIYTENNTIVDISNFSFEEIQLKSTSGSFMVKTSEESQDRNIYGSLWAVKKTLGDNHKLLLGVIAKSRYQGISQIKLAETLGWDAKMVFYYLKKLEQSGLISKEAVYADHRNTRVILLRKFKKDDENPNENAVDMYRISEFEDNLLALLKKAKNHIMLSQDAIKLMGFSTIQKIRWARVKINQLHEKGVIEKVNAFDGKIHRQSVRLLEPNQDPLAKVEVPEGIEEEEEEEEEVTKKEFSDTFYRDLPAEYQFYQDVVSAGENGIVRQELADKYPELDPHAFQLFFENVTKPPKLTIYSKYCIYRTEELEGRIRQFRYFAWDGWKKYNEKLGKALSDPEETPLIPPELKEPPAIDYVGKSFGIRPTTKIPISRLMKKKSSEDARTKPKQQRKRQRELSVHSESDNSDSLEQSCDNISKTKRMTRRKAEKDDIATPELSPDVSDTCTLDPTSTPDISEACVLDSIPLMKRKHHPDNENATRTINEKPELIVAPPLSSRLKRRKIPVINNTRSRRYGILLDMMEKQHIREVDKATIDEFNTIEIASPGGQKMALKTFNQMIEQLHEQKKLKLYVSTIQKPFGSTEMKRLLLHSSISKDSEELKQFIGRYSVENVIMNGRLKRKEFKTVDVAELPSIDDEAYRFYKAKDLETEKLSREYCCKYGWVKSKWIRSRKVHESLIQFYIHSNSNDLVVNMTEFIKYLSIDTLTFICSGLPYLDDSFRSFLDLPENREITLSALPQHIQLLIFRSKNKIKQVITNLLEILEALGVVEPLHALNSAATYAIAPDYKLCENGVIRDYAFKDRAVVCALPLSNAQNVRRFWDRLYSVCVNPLRYRSSQEDIDLEKFIDKRDPLRNIHNKRGWFFEAQITPAQKKILDSFVDFETKTIPLDNAALRIHLAQKTNLSTKRIRTYYAGILGALEKQKTKEEKMAAARQKLLASATDPTINKLILASLEGRKVDTNQAPDQSNPFVRPTFIGSRRVRKLRLRIEPGLAQEHAHRKYSLRTFHNFTPLEKDLLLYSYCIMKTRAKNLKFFWGPMTKLLTTRTKEQCRRAFNSMVVSQPGIQITIENLKRQWETFYKEGLETQQIVDKHAWDTTEFDLCSYVEYFILRLQEDRINQTRFNQVHMLPSSLQDFRDYYQIDRNIRLKETQKGKTHFSINHLNQALYDMPTTVTEFRPTNSVDLCKSLIKMLLTTPDSLYNAKLAYETTNQYSTCDIESAVEEMRAEGLIIKDHSRHSRIPGRSFNVSEKFLKISEGVVPFGMLDDAKAYHSIIATKKVVNVNQMNGGKVASILNLLSQKKITLRLKHKDKFIKAKDSLFYPKSTAENLCQTYINNHLDLVVQNTGVYNGNSDIYTDPETCIVVPTSDQVAVYLKNLDPSDTCLKVYRAVKSLQAAGGTFNDIKLSVNRKSRTDEREISRVVYNLTHHKPPLIYVVGFKQLRYVCTEFSPHWFLKTHDDKTLLHPLMWNDASGKVIGSAMDGCAKAVISHILMQPGISHANLRKKFDGFFTDYELHSLLKHLVDTKVVHSKKIQRGSTSRNVSIFEKRSLKFLGTDDGAIKCNEITFYWLSNDYYLQKQEK